MRAVSIVSVVAATMLAGTASAEAAIPIINFGNVPVVNSCYPPVTTGCVIKTAVFRNKTDHLVTFNRIVLHNFYSTFYAIQPDTCLERVIPIGGRCTITVIADPQSTGTVTGWITLNRVANGVNRVIRKKYLVVTGV